MCNATRLLEVAKDLYKLDYDKYSRQVNRNIKGGGYMYFNVKVSAAKL